MNAKQFKAVKDMSVEDASGFKYVKNTVKTTVFNTHVSTTTTKTVEPEELIKIREVISMYK